MRPALEQYELIERYLNNNLSDSELAAFKSKLATDASLRNEVKVYQTVNEMIMDQGLLEVKAKLKAIDSTTGPLNGSKPYLYTAVAVVAIAVIGYFTINNTKDATIIPTKQQPSAPINHELKKQPENTNAEQHVDKKSTAPLELDTQETAGEIGNDQTTPVLKESATDTQLNSNPEPVETTAEEKVKTSLVVCNLEQSDLRLSSTPSCNNSPTGSISIEPSSEFKGKLPVEFSLNRKDFKASRTYHYLDAGTYYVSVKDSDGCVWNDAKEIVVPEKDCREHEYAFSPDRGELWKFPVSSTGNYKIEIYNRNGTLVFRANVTNGQPDAWDGTSDGQTLPMGSYSYRITNDRETSDGFVTILR
jgi:gliding motility-associated-like protein